MSHYNLPETIPTNIDQEKLKISIIIRNLMDNIKKNKKIRADILSELTEKKK